MINVKEWKYIKDLLDTRNTSSLHYIETYNTYELVAIDKYFQLKFSLAKNSSDTTDLNDFLNNYKSSANKPMSNLTQVMSFSEKELFNGKKLFKRVHGVKHTVTSGTSNIEFTVPYNNCKITGVELLNGVSGDNVNFKVLDTSTGTISGVANQLLNQFGFDVYLAKDYHKEESSYDADLIKDMTVLVEFTATDTGSSRDVYINYILHEVK